MILPRDEMHAEEVGRHYDDLDTFYREIWGDHVHHGRWVSGKESTEQAIIALIDAVAAAANVREGSRVIDVGCGYGGTSRYLASKWRARVTGFTVSRAQHEYASGANQTLGGEVDHPQYELCPWENNSLPDESADALVSIECFTHVPDKEAYFREIHRVLKPGARAGLTVWMHNPDPTAWQIKHLIEPICYEGRLAAMGSADEYREMMQASGLMVVEDEDWSRQVQKTWSICLRRLVGKVFSSSQYRQTLLDKGFENRVFAVTLARILFAYRRGVMRYGFFILQRPE